MLSSIVMHNHLCITKAWCNDNGYDTTIHPIVKCVLFLEDLLAEMVAKNSKDPFGNIRVEKRYPRFGVYP